MSDERDEIGQTAAEVYSADILRAMLSDDGAADDIGQMIARTTISSSGTDITIACANHDDKEAIMAWLCGNAEQR
jgi:hypothetical protein